MPDVGPSAPPLPPTPGAYLRACRESASLTLEGAALRFQLTSDVGALAAVLHDAPRVAAAALVLVCLIQFWSLEVLCSAFTAKIERKRP